MVTYLVILLLLGATGALVGGWALSWPLWRPLDPVFEQLARRWPRPLPPERLQRRVLGEAERRISIGVNGGVLAPTAYEVRLAPEDVEVLGGVGDWFAGELSGALAEAVTARGVTGRRPPEVQVVEDPSRPRSRPSVAAWFENPTEVAGDWRVDGATAVDTHTAALTTWLLVPAGADRHDPDVIPLAGDEIVIGRSRAADVTLTDTTVSSRHARLRLRPDGRWEVGDLGSTNGTRVNGALLSDTVALSPGDELAVGGAAWHIEQP